MGKRKTFVKLETNTKTIEHSRDTTGRVVIPLDVIPPRVTEVRFSIRDNTSDWSSDVCSSDLNSRQHRISKTL